MRMSCNGCRVLRKGCSDDCSLRPCLEWIKTPESQANATVFLAKFYGRAGLMNLLNAGPEHLRPAIFRSLLYEACGRIVNPIYGSVGLLWSGNWNHCQNAVDAVLGGSQITEVPCDTAAIRPVLPLKAYDIRHLSKDASAAAAAAAAASSPHDLHKAKTRSRFKRCGARSKPHLESAEFCNPGGGPWNSQFPPADYNQRAGSHDSSLVQQETDSMFSVETVEASLAATPPKPNQLLKSDGQTDKAEAGLELTLGFHPIGGCKLEMGP